MKCVNSNCEEETINNNKYCSFKCRNIYVNKNLRDYTKYSKTVEEKEKMKKNEYYNNQVKCIECNNNIEYEKRKNKFCNSSCAATHTNKNRTVNNRRSLTEEAYKNILIANRKRSKKYADDDDILFSIKCKNCEIDISKRRLYCSDECKKKYKRKDLTEYEKYKIDAKFKFNLKYFENEFDFSLIEKFGWYKPSNRGNNLNGVSRDHMISISDGFELNINPLLLSHPANCKLMNHNFNISKNKKSSLTIEELLEKINLFDKKYGKYFSYEVETYIK